MVCVNLQTRHIILNKPVTLNKKYITMMKYKLKPFSHLLHSLNELYLSLSHSFNLFNGNVFCWNSNGQPSREKNAVPSQKQVFFNWYNACKLFWLVCEHFRSSSNPNIYTAVTITLD